jgi:hypothetical protein
VKYLLLFSNSHFGKISSSNQIHALVKCLDEIPPIYPQTCQNKDPKYLQSTLYGNLLLNFYLLPLHTELPWQQPASIGQRQDLADMPIKMNEW